jgi:hypothetical protein
LSGRRTGFSDGTPRSLPRSLSMVTAMLSTPSEPIYGAPCAARPCAARAPRSFSGCSRLNRASRQRSEQTTRRRSGNGSPQFSPVVRSGGRGRPRRAARSSKILSAVLPVVPLHPLGLTQATPRPPLKGLGPIAGELFAGKPHPTARAGPFVLMHEFRRPSHQIRPISSVPASDSTRKEFSVCGGVRVRSSYSKPRLWSARILLFTACRCRLTG